MHLFKTKASLFFTAAVLLSGLLLSCDNDPLTIGVETLPESDLLNAGTVAQSFSGKNIQPERIRTDGQSSFANAAGILGYFNDPVLGVTRADVVTEVTYSTQMDSFYMLVGDVFVDSVVLNIAYRYQNWYGNVNEPFTIQVYELSETLLPAPLQVYYNDEDIESIIYPDPIGEATFTIKGNVSDSVWQQQNYVHQISIRLSDELANRLINLTAAEMENRDAFKEVLNGLYVTVKQPDNPEAIGSLMKFDIWNEKTNLEMLYRHIIYDAENNDEILQIDRKNYIFPITTETRFFNRYQHDYNEDVIKNDIGTDHLYLQGMAGLYPEVSFSDIIKQWSDSLSVSSMRDVNYSISGVDFFFYPDTALMNGWDNLYMPMNQLVSLVAKDANGRFVPLLFTDKRGQTVEAFTRSVSDYNSTQNHFRFRMHPDFFMDVARGDAELESLFLTIPSPQFNFRRTVLFNQHDEFAPQMKVRYIKYK
ncbi:DUF4270 family protein [Alkalitalea saponilacus]|uniref:DUF4270 domain-containing protein n=1 Tax=Alkalitalea saponilacus TaxID=889453 RepID=A0A1T5HN77_9BACT|nr:DUF4270 family protein [Alkalitalea saponilacus]ASB49354.1 hypothetical protein CDL62_09470 [Alkalitalea saponilacus]SKC22126.1 protein of unknown function [Alkalitalea saponilacus]